MAKFGPIWYLFSEVIKGWQNDPMPLFGVLLEMTLAETNNTFFHKIPFQPSIAFRDTVIIEEGDHGKDTLCWLLSRVLYGTVNSLKPFRKTLKALEGIRWRILHPSISKWKDYSRNFFIFKMMWSITPPSDTPTYSEYTQKNIQDKKGSWNFHQLSFLSDILYNSGINKI